MTPHIYVRVAGFRLAIVPRAPFLISRASEPPNAVDVEYLQSRGTLFARVIPDDGGYRSKIDQYTSSLFDVLDIAFGPDIDHWRIETSAFVCLWPNNYSICSTNFPMDSAPFDLVGPNEERIYVQHPTTTPDIAAIRTANQAVVRLERSAASEWIELAYEHEGVPWRQRHEIVPIHGERLVVSVQSPLPFYEAAAFAGSAVARSLRPYDLTEPDQTQV